LALTVFLSITAAVSNASNDFSTTRVRCSATACSVRLARLRKKRRKQAVLTSAHFPDWGEHYARVAHIATGKQASSTMWYGYALLGPAIWALLNHLDKYVLGRFFNDARSAPVLVVFSGFAGFLVATAIALFGPSVRMPAPWQSCLAMGAGGLLI
jgi:hypothetical protein